MTDSQHTDSGEGSTDNTTQTNPAPPQNRLLSDTSSGESSASSESTSPSTGSEPEMTEAQRRLAEWLDTSRAGLSDLRRRERRAKANATPPDGLADPPSVPQAAEHIRSGPTSQFFDDDGSLRSASVVAGNTTGLSATDHALNTYPVPVLEAVLKHTDPAVHDAYTDSTRTDRFPDKTPRELVTTALRSACDAADTDLSEAFRQAGVHPSGIVFTITTIKDTPDIVRDETQAATMPTPAELRSQLGVDDPATDRECPQCGSPVEVQGKQTAAGDEGQTVFIRCRNCDYVGKHFS